MRRVNLSSKRAIAVWVVGGVLLVLAVAQLVLPRIAAARIRSRIGRYGSVMSVSVSAWPAIELLWGSVDSVRVRAGALALSPARAAELLWEGRGIGDLDLNAESVRIGHLRLSRAELLKRGSDLHAEGFASEADVEAALPAGVGVRLLRSEGGEVEVAVEGSLFGVAGGVDAVARASGGRLVVKPVGLLLGALQLTVFEEPHVYIEGVGVSRGGSTPGLYRLQVSARLQ